MAHPTPVADDQRYDQYDHGDRAVVAVRQVAPGVVLDLRDQIEIGKLLAHQLQSRQRAQPPGLIRKHQIIGDSTPQIGFFYFIGSGLSLWWLAWLAPLIYHRERPFSLLQQCHIEANHAARGMIKGVGFT